uniref:Uncharacterized protein n=1 Tax=Amphimedon queenslandica TaxID=400682 RepID=A0A1X7VPQ4_AMPQE
MKISEQRVPKKRILPQWMLESTNQQNAHTNTASQYKKQKRSDSFWGLKQRLPLQELTNSIKRRTKYFKNEKATEIKRV